MKSGEISFIESEYIEQPVIDLKFDPNSNRNLEMQTLWLTRCALSHVMSHNTGASTQNNPLQTQACFTEQGRAAFMWDGKLDWGLRMLKQPLRPDWQTKKTDPALLDNFSGKKLPDNFWRHGFSVFKTHSKFVAQPTFGYNCKVKKAAQRQTV